MTKKLTTEEVAETEVGEMISLHAFATANATKYGVELIAGFYHVQESEKHFADTEQNWHDLVEKFKKREVK